MIVVSDSGPLISLMKAEQLDLLHSLYGEVLSPEAVFSELTTNTKYAKDKSLWKRSLVIVSLTTLSPSLISATVFVDVILY